MNFHIMNYNRKLFYHLHSVLTFQSKDRLLILLFQICIQNFFTNNIYLIFVLFSDISDIFPPHSFLESLPSVCYVYHLCLSDCVKVLVVYCIQCIFCLCCYIFSLPVIVGIYGIQFVIALYVFFINTKFHFVFVLIVFPLSLYRT